MRWSAALYRTLALALPPRCPGCGTVTAQDHRFCAACWTRLRFLAPPWCAACNLPLAIDLGAEVRCADCLARPPVHDGVRAAVAYGAIARKVALGLKYGGRMAYADTVAQAMRRLMPDDTDLLVPVPLHPRRLWSRGFNQAGLIATALGRATKVPVDVSVLTRVRATPSLRGAGARARRAAVAGAFAVPTASRDRIDGRRLVLVDDVHTSGATTDACARTLRRAGARSVTILCWARVLPGEADD